MTCDYVDREGQDDTFTSRLELSGVFTLSQVDAFMDEGDLRVVYRLADAQPAGKIELLQCNYSENGQ